VYEFLFSWTQGKCFRTNRQKYKLAHRENIANEYLMQLSQIPLGSPMHRERWQFSNLCWSVFRCLSSSWNCAVSAPARIAGVYFVPTDRSILFRIRHPYSWRLTKLESRFQERFGHVKRDIFVKCCKRWPEFHSERRMKSNRLLDSMDTEFYHWSTDFQQAPSILHNRAIEQHSHPSERNSGTARLAMGSETANITRVVSAGSQTF